MNKDFQQLEIPIQPVEQPILCSPYEEPTANWVYDTETGEAHKQPGRRRAGYWYKTQRTGSQQLNLKFVQEEERDDLPLVNALREDVKRWRESNYRNATNVTRELLRYWTREDREPRLFFCQLEAVETIIYLVEIRRGGKRLSFKSEFEEADLTKLVDVPNEPDFPQLVRYGCKMATGSGKTVVMAMLIAWSFCNRGKVPSDERFPSAALIVCPNLTVKERLQVLRLDAEDNDDAEDNYYDKFDLTPTKLRPLLSNGKVLVTNWHRFAPESEHSEGGQSYAVVNKGVETPDAFAKRVLGELYDRAPIMVFNDEGHHAYRPAPLEEKLTGDDVRTAKEEREIATVWISGLDQINKACGVRFCVDLSATPFYIQGSGHPEGTPFPWLVSDFGLVDAIESGITKIPRLPVSDTTGRPEPKFFRLWEAINENIAPVERLPGRARKPKPEAVYREAEDALKTLASQWKERFEQVQQDSDSQEKSPPVMIIVCDNTDIAELFYQKISGEEVVEVVEENGDDEDEENDGRRRKRRSQSKTRTVYGQGRIFPELLSNAEGQGRTLRIDSKMLAAAESDDPNVSKGQAAEELRRIVATIGKRGELGEQIRCVVSVAMLNEGWDCLDRETEILTPMGWVGQRQVSAGDLVYSLNRNTGKLEVVPVLEYGERTVRPDERMVRIKSQHFDVRVTEGHQFHIKYHDPRAGGALSRNMIIRTGVQLFQRKSAYALPLAAETSIPFSGIPLTDDEIRLVAWFMTDGGFSNSDLAISQSKRFHHEIRSLLNRLKLDYTERVVEPGKQSFKNSKPVYVFRIPKGTHTGSLARNGWYKYRDYLDKSVASALHAMTRRQFLVFWEELLKGDGERQGNKSGWLWCCEKEQADAYTHMAVVRGLTASYHEKITRAGKTVYRVSVRDAQWMTSQPSDKRTSKITLEPPEPDEVVWCIRNQNSTLVTRRNGKIAILGNCNTVTHILGLRAFESQLLCEQVVGRSLRRMDYTLDPETGLLAPEYADVYGIPFSVIPFKGRSTQKSTDDKPPKRVRAMRERSQYEIRFPVVEGYAFALRKNEIKADILAMEHLRLEPEYTPTAVFVKPTVGFQIGSPTGLGPGEFTEQNRQAYYETTHIQTIKFEITRQIVLKLVGDSKTSPDPKSNPELRLQSRHRLFPQVFRLVEAYVNQKVDWRGCHECELGQEKYVTRIVERLLAAIQPDETEGESPLMPILNRYKPIGSSAEVDFITTRNCHPTQKSHIDRVVLDTQTWESSACFWLEQSSAVDYYVRNDHLGFVMPYEYTGVNHGYEPDFLVRLKNGKTLILEIKGFETDQDIAKHAAAKRWIAAVNNWGKLGQWDFHVCRDPQRLRQELGFLAEVTRLRENCPEFWQIRLL